MKEMSFDEFLATHDIIDFAWEIFKGISPTIIALVTIGINTLINRRKSEKETKLEQIKELQLMVSNLSPYIVETGEYLLDSIQHAEDKEKSDELFEEYYKANSQMLIETRKFLAYANIRAEVLKNEHIVFTDVCAAITKYSYELADILEWYNEQAARTHRDKFELLCDEVQQKLIFSTERAEKALFDYATNLIK